MFAWLALALAGCAQLPTTGPNADEIEQSAAPAAASIIQIVDVDDRVARRLLAQRSLPMFSDTLVEAPAAAPAPAAIGVGDSVEIMLWEAPPATLFSPSLTDVRTVAAAGTTTLPPQVVDHDGFVLVPFAGRVRAAGQTPQAVAADIVARLRGKANQPEALVRVNRASSTVTVVGEVANSVRMPLTPSGERLLDALAAAGGVRQPVAKMTVQLTRGNQYQSLPLDVVIRDPRQNVTLKPGDVVTAIFQPLSFTALGATGRQEEVNFEAQGISLAQALARVGGLLDNRASPQGVFVFRFEPRGALDWPRQPAHTTPEGLVPVVYRMNLRDPGSFFVMQSFAMHNKDVLYVSNAPAAELQKFLNLIFSVVFPVANLINATN